jgi:O-antigen ligase
MPSIEVAWLAALALCVGLAVTGFAYSHPRLALVATFFVVPVAGIKFRLRDPTQTLTGNLDWQIALELGLYGVLAICVLMAIASGQVARERLAPAEHLLILFLVFMLGSTLWSNVPQLSLVRACQMVVLGTLALTSVRLLGATCSLRAAMGGLVTYVLVCGTIGLFSGVVYSAESTFRLTWFQVHPISAGTSAALAALLVVGRGSYLYQSHARVPVKLFTATILLALVSVLFLTNSRGPLFAFIAAAGAIAWKFIGRGWLRLLVGLMIVLAIHLAMVVDFSIVMPSEGDNNIVSQRLFRGGDLENLKGLNGRLAVWEAAMPLILEKPMFGYGYLGARPILSAAIPWASYAHSAYVQSLLDFGIIGGLLMWGLYISALLTLLRRPFGNVTGIAWCDTLMTGVATFIAVLSISSEVVGGPGYEALVMFLVVVVAGRGERSVHATFRRSADLRMPALLPAASQQIHRNHFGVSRVPPAALATQSPAPPFVKRRLSIRQRNVRRYSVRG